MRKGAQHILLGDDHFRVLAADILGHHARIFQVDRIHIHADGKGLDRLFQLVLRDGADQRRIQAAGEQEAHRRICIQTLFHALDQQIMQLGTRRVLVVHGKLVDMGSVGIAHKLAVRPVAAGREGENRLAEADQVLRLTGKRHAAVRELAVVQRADADRIARSDQGVLLRIIEDERKLRIQRAEHIQTVFAVKRKQDLAVRLTGKRVFRHQPVPNRAESIQLAVADHIIVVKPEGLHAALIQAHDGQAMKAEPAAWRLDQAAHIRPARKRAIKALFDDILRNRFANQAENGTHVRHLQLAAGTAILPAAKNKFFRMYCISASGCPSIVEMHKFGR